MSNIVQLEVGDWSRDGHNQSDIWSFRCNFPQEAVIAAYEKGCVSLGFDLIEEYCSEYEEYELPEEIRNTLLRHVVEDDGRQLVSELADEWISSSSWATAVMVVARVGEPSLRFKMVDTNTWKVGGYGLYE